MAVGKNPTGGLLSLTTGAPNPFRSQTRIAFELATGGPVDLSIYDARGRRVRSLLRETLEAGRHVAIWEGRDESGESVPPGMYFSVLKADGEMRSRKILLID